MVNFGVVYATAPDPKYPPFHQPEFYIISLQKLFGTHASPVDEAPGKFYLLRPRLVAALYELAHSTLAVIK